jgi:hypothetical protein
MTVDAPHARDEREDERDPQDCCHSIVNSASRVHLKNLRDWLNELTVNLASIRGDGQGKEGMIHLLIVSFNQCVNE